MSSHRMTKAISDLVINQPFFGTLALQLERVEAEDAICKTMATDGIKLYWNAKFVESLPAAEVQGVIVHEIFHCAFQHMTRRKNRDMKRWNIAADYAINLEVLGAGFKLPKDALLDHAYRGLGAEEIYARLAKDQPKPKAGQPGASGQKGGQGKGEGQKGPGTEPGEESGADSGGGCPWGMVLDAAPAHSPAQAAEIAVRWDMNVRQAMAIAGKRAGTIPASFKRLVEEAAKPEEDWREALRSFVDCTSGYEQTWANPNRRLLSMGYVFPGEEKDQLPKLGIVIDTSGSINQPALKKFQAEVQSILDCGIVREVLIIYCDTEVRGRTHYHLGDQIRIDVRGGGGTRFSPAFKWFNEEEPDVAALIYFTDMQCNDFGPEPSYPVLWAAYGFRSDLAAKSVPFGNIIKITE